MLLEQFDTIFDTPESVRILQESILEMAFKGKLVPQDSNDKSVDVLLGKIRNKKETLIKEKKVKKNKPLPPVIIEEENLYELPANWNWIRLGEIGNVFNGNSINAKAKEEKYSKVTHGYDYIATKDIHLQMRKIEYNNGIKIPFDEEKFKVAHRGAVLICAEGGSAGKKIGIIDRDVCFGNKLFAIETYEEVDSKYIYFLYQSSFFYKAFSSRMTGIIGGISIGKFKEIPIPLPPVPEQKRIIKKVEQLMFFCEELKKQLEKKKKREDRFNISTFSFLEQSVTEEELQRNLKFVLSNMKLLFTDIKHVQQLRNAILSLALKGKLVSKGKNEEPASVLLEKLRLEKEKLIKEKKIKKEKSISRVINEQKTFSLNPGWEWAVIDDLGCVITGKTPPTHTPEYYNGEIPFLNPANISRGKVNYDGKRISVEGAKYSQLIPTNSIMMVCINGSLENGIGRVGKTEKTVAFNQQINSIIPYENINVDYLLLALQSPYFQKQIKKKATGTVNYIVNKNNLRSLVLPLPPLQQQKRIVEKVDQLMCLCDEIESSLKRNNKHKLILNQAIQHQDKEVVKA